MKGFEKLAGESGGKTNRRKPNCLFLLLCWLLLLIWPALAQETLEAQSIRFRLIPGGWYFVGSPPNETGRYADEAACTGQPQAFLYQRHRNHQRPVRPVC
jgi:hypothetical protein